MRLFVNLSETVAGYRSNRSPLLIMLTEPTFCRNSSINILIDNQYDNRFIHLRRPIFTVNHNGACVYTTDYTWDRACACYTREAPLTQSANWVSDHRYSIARFSYCSLNKILGCRLEISGCRLKISGRQKQSSPGRSDGKCWAEMLHENMFATINFYSIPH